MNGAAIECRIYAEDPDNNFFPSPGTIRLLQTPTGPGIRDDSGVYEGWSVPIDYDPLISKLVAWGPTRKDAMDRMLRVLREYRVEGIQTNLNFFVEVLNDSDFRNGQFDTGHREVDEEPHGPAPPSQLERDLAVLSAILAEIERGKSSAELAETGSTRTSLWKTTGRRESLRH
jgi:acetyl-CoA carboxylase biotin carboxylase subunit